MHRPIIVRPRLCVALTAGLLGVVAAGSAVAQSAARFDSSVARLSDRTRFVPLQVTETRSLHEALDDGLLSKDTPLLVIERGSLHLALLTRQMTYHHIAQGELAGEPWMVSF